MGKTDRQTKLEPAKAIGRVAYRLVRALKVEGFLETDGERTMLRKFDSGVLTFTLYEATNREPSDDDFSQLRAHHAGKRVFDIRWTRPARFKIIKCEPGEWERMVR